MSWLVPEILQTSAMDCGPAALQSLLQGHDIQVNFNRLREACQVQVDGTSIDQLEEVARQLGLDAEQQLVPSDHLLRPEQQCLPALAVVLTPSRMLHFVVIWKQIAGRVQIMDPARGRRFISPDQLRSELPSLRVKVAAGEWRQYAGTREFTEPLRARIAELTDRDHAARLISAALADETHVGMATLDAATRAVAQLARTGAADSAQQRARLIERWVAADQRLPIPEPYWYALPSDDGEHVALGGALIVRIRGKLQPSLQLGANINGINIAQQRALYQPTPAVLPRVLGMLRGYERRKLWPLALVAVCVSLAAQLETVLLRGELELGRYVTDPLQQSSALMAVLGFMLLVTLLQLAAQHSALALGRTLEARLRVALSSKFAQLDDGYLHSRPISDLADRAHMVHLTRGLPAFFVALLSALLELAMTAAALVWLDPSCTGRVLITCLLSLALPLGALSTLSERDARQRNHAANLAGYYFDALRGSVALHAQHGSRAVLAEHEAGLAEWQRAGLDFARASIWLDALVSFSGLGLSIWLFAAYLSAHAEPLGALLFLFWAMALPSHGRELALLTRQWPSFINVLKRLFEPLDAAQPATPLWAAALGPGAAAISFESVSVQAGGHALLTDVQLRIEPGEHVAIVGASGAGKSSLLGLILGWYRPTQGRVLCDAEELDEARLRELRPRTVWLDPSVQLWDRSLHHNLTYAAKDEPADLSDALSGSELQSLLESLPEGLQTGLGEAGCRLSGGEGQRVRFARGLLIKDPKPKLVLLDEPFRGVDRAQRARLLAAARRNWAAATMLCVTHDITETLSFSRVLVVDAGRIVEDGTPAELAARGSSQYATLLRSERVLLEELFGGSKLRRVRLEHGELHEIGSEQQPRTHAQLSRTITGIGPQPARISR